jgi:hypothetical protein
MAGVLWMPAVLSAPPAAIASIIMWSENSTTWQWPLFAWAALAGLAYLGVHVGPVLDGRRWVAVADGGLVVWYRDCVETFPWDEARGVDVGRVCNLGDVRDSIAQGRPVGARTRRRITGLTITGLVTAVAVWFTAVPMAQNVFVGERPTDLTHFARTCDGGRPFGRTAAYAGPAPHPVALYVGLGNFPDYVSDPRPEPDAVQLVGCVRLIGKVSPGPIEVCRYTEGHTSETYQGRYRVDIYEARTGRQVTSFNLDGDADDTCSRSILVERDAEGGTSKFHTHPSRESYRAQLDPLVNG